MERKLQDVYRKDFSTHDGAAFRDIYLDEGTHPRSLDKIEIKAGRLPTLSPGKRLTSAEIRLLDRPTIRNMLLESISQLINVDKSLIRDGAPLNSYMDSVTLAQLKGLLEGQYAVSTMSDAYLFNDTTTLKKLSEVVKVGVAKDDTTEGGSGGGVRAGGGGSGPGCCGCRVM